MAYARPNKTQTGPRTPARRGRVARVSAQPTNPLVDFIESAGTTNFGLRVWMAWDPPTAVAPGWVDITPWVEQDKPVSISPHGRTDGLADANASRLSLTVDNSDGRFTASNPSGPWFGSIHKGNWIKVEVVPPSGTVSQRFVGFVTNLPTAWQGQYAISQITASDRFEKLGQAPALVSAIQSEVLTDPSLSGNVKAYWNLHEATGSTTFGDTSGNASAHMVLKSQGAAGVGFGASNVAGPGFDNLRAVTFNPVSATQGSYLTASVALPPGSWSGTTYTGLLGTMEFWVQATTTSSVQYLAAIVDPIGQTSVTLVMDANGYLSLQANGASASNNSAVVLTNWATSGILAINDGKWHLISIGAVGTTNSSGGVQYQFSVDNWANGAGSASAAFGIANLTAYSGYSQLIIGAGYNAGVLNCGAGNFSDVAWFWADYKIAGSLNNRPPNVTDHYAAGTTGFLGESTDKRVARIARYAGVPIPLTLTGTSNPGNFQVYNAGVKGAWTNLSAGAHSCGSQSVSGRKALDVMREAARTEGMPLFVDRSGYLALQPSTIRQNTTAAWTVDARDLDPNTALADDFAYTVNQMTVTPNSQAAQTVIGTVGQASQNKYGQYDKSQATASLNPVEARSLGLSYIQLGADPAPRLAPLIVEAATLATQAGYGASWYDAVLATEISTPIRVTNPPSQTGASYYDVLIEGWTETITAGNHVFSFTTSPVQGPTYVADDAVLGHADTDGSTLAAAVTSAATTLYVATTNPASPQWTASPSDFPFDLSIDSEQVTATAAGAANFGADGTFETGVSGWSLSNATLAQSSAATHSGSFGGLLTSAANNAFYFFTARFPCTGGMTYVFSHWVKLAAGTPTLEWGFINWYNSGGTNVGTTSTSQITPTGTWTLQTVTATIPATAVTGQMFIQATAAAAGNAIYVDDITLPQPFTVTRSVNGVVASHNSGAAVALWQPLTLAY